ncbi:tryptophan synthase subunit alpha [Gammaproteobacteria bacterium AS21]
MSRIESCFTVLKEQGRKALIPFITAGDPSAKITLSLMHDMVKSGADIIELGVPFSDPSADGPVIQLACERALLQGTRLIDVLEIVRQFRETNDTTPVVLMGYLNPIERMGYQNFADAAQQAGVDGVLTVDLPPQASAHFGAIMKAAQLDIIYLLAPTTTQERVKLICQYASGYLYYVSVKGVTGSAALDVNEVAEKLAIVRQHTDIAIGVGFGINNGESAAAVAKIADGVIVGSVLVKQIAGNLEQTEKINVGINGILSEMRQAMDAN